MTDKMREEFERDHEAALQEIHYCPETDRYVAVDDSDGYALDYAVAMNNEWRVHKRAWQAAKSVPDAEIMDSRCTYFAFAGHVCNKCGRIHDGGKSVPVVGEPDCYDAGLLNDFGGGNVGWWQDYIRAELSRAHEFYANQWPTTSITEAELQDLRMCKIAAREEARRVDELTAELERLRKIEQFIKDSFHAYERFGASCHFEGMPMVNASIIEEAAAIGEGMK